MRIICGKERREKRGTWGLRAGEALNSLAAPPITLLNDVCIVQELPVLTISSSGGDLQGPARLGRARAHKTKTWSLGQRLGFCWAQP